MENEELFPGRILYTEVLQIRKAALGENDENYITALSNLARVYLDAADYKKPNQHFCNWLTSPKLRQVFHPFITQIN